MKKSIQACLDDLDVTENLLKVLRSVTNRLKVGWLL
jgi:hypothetical protein